MAFDNYVRRGHVLYPGQSLHANECLVSECGRFYVCLQPDGNFVQYRWNPNGRHVCWSSKTHHNSFGYEKCTLLWGPRGQIVLQDDIGDTFWTMLDASHLHDHPQELIIQNDSNFVYYKKGNKPVWSSHSQSHDTDWVVPDCRVVTIKQKSTDPGPPGQIVIESRFDHAVIKFESEAGRIVLPNSKESISVSPGTLEVTVGVPHPFDASGKPTGPVLPVHEGDSIGHSQIKIRPGDIYQYPITAGTVATFSLY